MRESGPMIMLRGLPVLVAVLSTMDAIAIATMHCRLPGELRCKANGQDGYCAAVPPVFGP